MTTAKKPIAWDTTDDGYSYCTDCGQRVDVQVGTLEEPGEMVHDRTGRVECFDETRWQADADIDQVADWLISQCAGKVLDDLVRTLMFRYAVVAGADTDETLDAVGHLIYAADNGSQIDLTSTAIAEIIHGRQAAAVAESARNLHSFDPAAWS